MPEWLQGGGTRAGSSTPSSLDLGDSAEFEEALLLAMLAHHAGAPADVVERCRRELADAWDRTREGRIT